MGMAAGPVTSAAISFSTGDLAVGKSTYVDQHAATSACLALEEP